jgi:hypothetical protein
MNETILKKTGASDNSLNVARARTQRNSATISVHTCVVLQSFAPSESAIHQSLIIFSGPHMNHSIARIWQKLIRRSRERNADKMSRAKS